MKQMRILILHSRYQSGWASGENSVVRDETTLLTQAGHSVVTWTPTPENIPAARLGAMAVWSASAVRHVRGLIEELRPEIVHCHNLFPMLSPAVVRAAKNANANVVVTLHNYRLSCLPATFFRDEEICELCAGRQPWRGVLYRCYRDSLPGSAALAGSLTVHRALRSFDRVSLFLPVSRFLRDKHIKAGWSPDRMTVKPNFSWARPRREGLGAHFAYIGRLSPEKDVTTLLDAWRSIREPLVVVGDGPLRRVLQESAPRNVEFTGTVSADEVNRVLGGARALLFPTRWYEGAPRSIIEAYAAGVPVIGTSIGAVTESIEPGLSGFLVAPRSADAWVEAVNRMMDPSMAADLAAGAHDLWLRRYSPERGLHELESAYRLALSA